MMDKWCDKAAARSVDMNRNVEPLLFFQIIERESDLLNRLVLQRWVTPRDGTTPIVFSSQRRSTSSGDIRSRCPSHGISRSSTSKYRPNLCRQICTGPQIRLGFTAGLPARSSFLRHVVFSARPPNMAASLEPVVEHPWAFAASDAFHRSASMRTHRDSISAVCGYSSLSIMFLSMHSSINLRTSGSTQVWQNVARFW